MDEERQAAWRTAHARAADDVRARLERAAHALDEWCAAAPHELDQVPAPGRWSPRQILEHVALANHFLLVLARKLREKSRARLARGDPWPTAPPRHAELAALAGRGEPWPHPEHMTPTDTRPLSEVRTTLADQFHEAAHLVDEMPAGEGTLHRIRMSRLAGEDRLGLVEYVDVLARHAERHLSQLRNPLKKPSP